MTAEDRDILLRRIHEDLIGPFQEEEILTTGRPSDVYLTGILWPSSSRMSEEENDRLGLAGGTGDDGDGSSEVGEEESVSTSNITRPCSAGISFAASTNLEKPVLNIQISFGKYTPVVRDDNSEVDTSRTHEHPVPEWRRIPILITLTDYNTGEGYSRMSLQEYGAPPNILLHRRIVPWRNNWLITLTLINNNPASRDREINEINTLFQVKMKITPGRDTRLIARPLRRMSLNQEPGEEERSSALLYRNSFEYAVGHTCSAEWIEGESGTALMVATTWIPQALVPATNTAGHHIFNSLRLPGIVQPLSTEWISKASDTDLRNALLEFTSAYEQWINLQRQRLDSLETSYRDQAIKNIERCEEVRARMVEGASQIYSDPAMSEAFRLANRAMAIQYRWNPDKKGKEPLMWRPFQLGFILLTLPSIANHGHSDRNVMDLLWFPTGGGKTEAYLGLIAFLAFYRRLSQTKNPDSGAGVAAIMRYTLRLLTTQQFVRAAAVILACEKIRRERPEKFGKIPFSIGLWVGNSATPNKFEDAKRALSGESTESSPEQLAFCPACGKKLHWYFDSERKAIYVRCNQSECALYKGNTPLPVFTVDDDIYREHPTLLIGTVDKFAQIVRKSQVNSLFSIQSGNPPDLIVQDELHLISGPLGTLVGLYEVAIDKMFTRDGKIPKIIGSTATIRRAGDQVRALFNRSIRQFPPPAIDADDYGFAVTDPDAPGRLYAGITTAGRSAKFTLQAVAASLLQSATDNLTAEGRDNYWTMVSYFNSLRELGGALVLMQDDVNDSISLFAGRRNETPRRPGNIEELTSRRTQEEVRDMLNRLAVHVGNDGVLDIVLATNMLSVGVDIPRLGLMLVNGQPKSISEYIQATSRIGRGLVPGLIITVLNNAKPRDRSHYESFSTWHSTLYRDVEATSVTPFASRARDRALHAILVAMVRHTVPGMLNDPPHITPEIRAQADNIIEEISRRSRDIDSNETSVALELRRMMDEWMFRDPGYYWDSYRPQQSLLQDAERAAAMRALGRQSGNAWPTMNNLRSVEPSTRFRLTEHLKIQPPHGE
jgi:hypothetical protein